MTSDDVYDFDEDEESPAAHPSDSNCKDQKITHNHYELPTVAPHVVVFKRKYSPNKCTPNAYSKINLVPVDQLVMTIDPYSLPYF